MPLPNCNSIWPQSHLKKRLLWQWFWSVHNLMPTTEILCKMVGWLVAGCVTLTTMEVAGVLCRWTEVQPSDQPTSTNTTAHFFGLGIQGTKWNEKLIRWYSEEALPWYYCRCDLSSEKIWRKMSPTWTTLEVVWKQKWCQIFVQLFLVENNILTSKLKLWRLLSDIDALVWLSSHQPRDFRLLIWHFYSLSRDIYGRE